MKTLIFIISEHLVFAFCHFGAMKNVLMRELIFGMCFGFD